MMSRFAQSGFQPVEVDGRLVHPMLRLDAEPGDRAELSWLPADSPRMQGVGVRLRVPGVAGVEGSGGMLRVETVDAAAISLWMDTSPPVVAVEVVEVSPDGQLQVSNKWRTDDGREDEWLNNYGMLIDQQDEGEYVLHCSDGFGYALNSNFDDLVVRVKLLRS